MPRILCLVIILILVYGLAFLQSTEPGKVFPYLFPESHMDVERSPPPPNSTQVPGTCRAAHLLTMVTVSTD